MSDEQNLDDELDLEESSTEAPRKKGSLFSPFLIRILLLIAAGLAMVFIAAVVFMIGSKFVTQRAPAVVRPDQWDQQVVKTRTEHLDYLVLEDPFRQQLLDGKMIQLKITLGYKTKDKKLQQEISQIKPEIRDIIIKHLSRMRSDEFVDKEGSSLERLEEDFLKQINRILNNGKVERILFQEYTLMM